MYIKSIAAMLALIPAFASAQTVSSPDGNVSLTFSLTEGGKPTYEMTYKGKKVVNPSHLGLELAKDKHASKGMQSQRSRQVDDKRLSAFAPYWWCNT